MSYNRASLAFERLIIGQKLTYAKASSTFTQSKTIPSIQQSPYLASEAISIFKIPSGIPAYF